MASDSEPRAPSDGWQSQAMLDLAKQLDARPFRAEQGSPVCLPHTSNMSAVYPYEICVQTNLRARTLARTNTRFSMCLLPVADATAISTNSFLPAGPRLSARLLAT